MQQEQDCLQLNEQINTAFIRLIALSADNFQVQLNKPKRYDVNNRPMQQQNKITSHTPWPCNATMFVYILSVENA